MFFAERQGAPLQEPLSRGWPRAPHRHVHSLQPDHPGQKTALGLGQGVGRAASCCRQTGPSLQNRAHGPQSICCSEKSESGFSIKSRVPRKHHPACQHPPHLKIPEPASDHVTLALGPATTLAKLKGCRPTVPKCTSPLPSPSVAFCLP